jgi:hypothetical protein
MLLITISKTSHITPDLEMNNDVRITNDTVELCCYLIVCLILVSYFVSLDHLNFSMHMHDNITLTKMQVQA